ncbi:hypothetical protein F2Q69_00021867 [Brassica cretica]|uniref:Uncharacterized protein n=1 Tax=Brassica cretica TaxID=69181 RepID=A0A8S9QFB4_BRACR|nr:hypothetical protein F2Q69_00021867 [Brassica cretica]
MQCHLWFPFLEIIVRFFSRFGLGFFQITLVGLQHIIVILVLSYERGIPLDIDHLEALLMFKGNTGTIQLGPRPNKAIIVDFVNYRVWTQPFFFVRIISASVEESYIPVLRTTWGRREINPLPPVPEGLTTIIGLLRSGDFYWGTPKRVRRIVVLHRSRFQPDLPIEEEEDESSMDGFVPSGGGCFPDTLVGDYFDGEPFDLEELLGSNPPEAEGGSVKGPEFTKASWLVNAGLLVMNWDLDTSIQEARMAQFRAEKAKKEIARLRDELECSRRDEGSFVATEIRRPIGEEECGKIWRMNERAGDFAIPRMEENIWKQWEPITVSPDTVEAETGVPDETGGVNQPVVPLTVDDYLVGELMVDWRGLLWLIGKVFTCKIF